MISRRNMMAMTAIAAIIPNVAIAEDKPSDFIFHYRLNEIGGVTSNHRIYTQEIMQHAIDTAPKFLPVTLDYNMSPEIPFDKIIGQVMKLWIEEGYLHAHVKYIANPIPNLTFDHDLSYNLYMVGMGRIDGRQVKDFSLCYLNVGSSREQQKPSSILLGMIPIHE